MHRDAGHSVGLHLFQELSTLGQQVAHTLLLGKGLRGIEPMFPASTSRTRQLTNPSFRRFRGSLRNGREWLMSRLTSLRRYTVELVPTNAVVVVERANSRMGRQTQTSIMPIPMRSASSAIRGVVPSTSENGIQNVECFILDSIQLPAHVSQAHPGFQAGATAGSSIFQPRINSQSGRTSSTKDVIKKNLRGVLG